MLQRPLWTEGTLLCPQHLQQQDLYYELLLAARLAATVPLPWGVLAVRFDPAALAAGQLALTHLRAILPDGTPLDLHEHHLPPPRAVAPHFPAKTEEFLRPFERGTDLRAAVLRGFDALPTRQAWLDVALETLHQRQVAGQ